ncbi:hypothetical protein [Methanobacterium spitsbergense]|uniref:Uncharacterized protein n=1 Tax=Methanobacterium spitsbergense TaxID=2874285 RepID=A0A8T5UPA7_9EURY|nr:hypothetical protein [Methanobacterium spitsbergense]MBZ2165822.1 hypothetical protein [Methanobacterium spitsbergense]
MFQEQEEVIVYTRNEFNRFYTSMMEQINYINQIDLYLDKNEDWKLIGYWPKLMEKVHILDVNMESILTKEPIQAYMNSSPYNTVKSSQKNIARSKRKVSGQIKLPI